MRLRSLVWLSALLTCVAVAVPQARADLVTVSNPGFESNDFTGWTYHDGDPLDPVSGTGCGCDGVVEGIAHQGKFSAFFGAMASNSTLSQSISTTNGETYHVSFWLMSDGGTPNFFSASFDGKSELSLTNQTMSGFEQFGFDATATGNSSDLSFAFSSGGFLYFDDVSVVASVPGPLAGAGLPGLLAGFGAIFVWYRKRRATV